jgi:hypothetical protein
MTNNTLSSDIATSFRQRAALVDPAAANRIVLRVADARPRSGRRLALAGSAAGAAGIGAVVAAAVTLSGATPAFAGWTAKPSSVEPTDAASATTTCAQQLASMPDGPGSATWTPTAADVRGPYVLEALVSGSMSATCLTGPSVTSVSFGSGGGSLSSSGTPSGVDPGGTSSTTNYAAGDAVTQLTLSSLDTQNGAPFDTLEGTVSPDVTAVSLALSDGQSIQGTVSGGLVLAWWPNGSKPVTAQVTTTSGTTTQQLGTFGPGPGAIVHSNDVSGTPGSLHVNKSSAQGGPQTNDS